MPGGVGGGAGDDPAYPILGRFVENPVLWLLFVGLFTLAGIINLARGLRRTDSRRSLSIGLGLSSFLWAASAGLFRFVDHSAGYFAAVLASVLMVGASLAGMRQRR